MNSRSLFTIPAGDVITIVTFLHHISVRNLNTVSLKTNQTVVHAHKRCNRVFPGQILSIVLVRYYVLVRFPRDADEQKKRTTLHSVEVHPPCQLGNKKASVKQNRKFDADD